MKRKIILTVGLIASGKTTWSKQYVKDNPNTYRVSRDDLRFMTTDYQYTPENEKNIDKIYKSIIENLLMNTNKDIICDEQNLNRERREEFKKWILSIDSNIEFIEKEFPITLGEALERDRKRDFSIGEKVIKSTWRKYEISLKAMSEKHKPKYEFNEGLPYCCLVDIDGTISNSYQRRIFDYKECINDELIKPVADILYKYQAYNIPIIFLSGREEICRKETEEWLIKFGFYPRFLYMRKEKDYRDDTIVKSELFYHHPRKTTSFRAWIQGAKKF